MFKSLLILAVALLAVRPLQAQQHISFATKDGGKICADVYGKGKRAVVLAHGGFTKEPQLTESDNRVYLLALAIGPLANTTERSKERFPGPCQ